MSLEKQSGGDDGPARPNTWGRNADVDAQMRQGIGDEFRKNLMYGGLGGLGIGGLYYLSQYLTDKYRKATDLPSPTELAAAPISEVTAPDAESDSVFAEMPTIPFMGGGDKKKKPTQKAAKFDPMFIAAPALGAGAGALIGAARAPKGRRRQNAILGATLGGVGGLGTAAATSKPVWDYVSKQTEDMSVLPWNWFGGRRSDIDSRNSSQDAWRNVLNATLPAAGAAGGLMFMDSAMRQNEDEQNLQKVDAARREYFSALTGQEPRKKDDDDKDEEKPEKKSSVDEKLDSFYELYATKQAEEPGVQRTFANWWNNITTNNPDRNYGQWLYDVALEPGDRALKDTNSLATTLMLAGGLGAGAIGAKYMYDQTKARSAARNLQLAQAARRRMQGLDTPWVDPTELAEIKQMATADEAAQARGV